MVAELSSRDLGHPTLQCLEEGVVQEHILGLKEGRAVCSSSLLAITHRQKFHEVSRKVYTAACLFC